MTNKKARKIDSIQGKLELFFGSLLFIAGVTACVTLLFTGMFLSWWVVLPVILFVVSPFIIAHAFTELAEENKTEVKKLEGESEEDYQKAVELNNMLEKLHRYGKGERIPEENSALFKQLKASQTAHFMLSLQAEIEDKPTKSLSLFGWFLKWLFSSPKTLETLQKPANTVPDDFEQTVVSLLEEADTAFKSAAKSSSAALEDKSAIFKRLFTGILGKTEITRKVFTGSFQCKLEKDKPVYKKVTKQLILFGANPDGECVDYCMGMYDREDTWDAISPYQDNELFKRIMFFTMEDNTKITKFHADPAIKKLSKEFNVLNKISFNKKTDEQKKTWETLRKQIDARREEVANYDDGEKFMAFFKKEMRNECLEDTFAAEFCNDVRRDGKKLVLWRFRDEKGAENEGINTDCNPDSNEIYSMNNPEPQKHYLHKLDIGKHANPLVEIDDFEGLIQRKRHENRFRLCQTQEAYELYRATWIRP